MPFSFTCSRCGGSLKDHWLVCRHCHQPRWNIIAKYFIYGGAALAVAFAIIVLDKNQNLACAAAILVALGVTLVLIAAVGTLLGLIAKKEGQEEQPTFHAMIDNHDRKNSTNRNDKGNR